jgi:hypothetical protein
VNQVEIPHPLAQFGIDEAVVLVGRRRQRLREKLEVRHEHGHLAGLRPAEPAIHADDVAEVEAVDDLPNLGADLLLAEHQLDPAGAVMEIDEHEAPGTSQQHDSPGDADSRPVVRCLVEPLAPGPHVGDRRGAIEPFSPRIDTQSDEPVKLVSAGLFQLGSGARGGLG